jgi:hypothetical protein
VGDRKNLVDFPRLHHHPHRHIEGAEWEKQLDDHPKDDDKMMMKKQHREDEGPR